MRYPLLAAVLSSAFLPCANVAAQPVDREFRSSMRTVDPLSTGYLNGYAGAFDFIQDDNDAFMIGGEYRFTPIFEHGLRPTIGVFLTDDSTVYAYGGFNWDISLGESWYIVPSFAVGLYNDGDGKDLGGALEFRSGIGIAYQLENAHRIALELHHLSNASIYDRNPGTETLTLNYSVPLAF